VGEFHGDIGQALVDRRLGVVSLFPTHRAHSHPNNYLSAVYYVRTWPGADSINFHDLAARLASSGHRSRS
jgi:hypothetical protein